MKTPHPTPEDWMTFLYKEAPPAQQAAWQAHLDQCADCARQVAAWRGGMKVLDCWPPAASPAELLTTKPRQNSTGINL